MSGSGGEIPAVAEPPKPAEGLSQFTARVLDQLLLSSWLPSAAAVLGVAFLLQLGSILDAIPPSCGSRQKPQVCAPAEALMRTASSLAHFTLGGAVVLIVVVVTSTMFTQAFAFEAIRALEGYWGTCASVERYAQWRVDRFRRKRKKVAQKLSDLTKEALNTTIHKIKKREKRRKDRGLAPFVTPNMIKALRVGVIGPTAAVQLTDDESKRLSKIKWKEDSDPEILRRRLNVSKKLADYPSDGKMLPTHLGNVLRHYEEAMKVTNVESFVQDNFDLLTPSMQKAHDEEKTRLDLYCTMVFVLPVVGLTGFVRLWPSHPQYAWTAAGLVLFSVWLTYRAALVSARAYGSVLVSIAGHIKRIQQSNP